jgi:hypothetical protein
MANLFLQNPFVLDTVWTANTIPTDLTTAASAGAQAFSRIVWSGGTAGDTIVFTDLNGNVILEATCPSTGTIVLWQNSGVPILFKQSKWVLLTMAHGKVTLQK